MSPATPSGAWWGGGLTGAQLTDLYDGLVLLYHALPDADPPSDRDARVAGLMGTLLPLVPDHWVGLDQHGEVVYRFRRQSDADHALANRRVVSIAPAHQPAGGAS